MLKSQKSLISETETTKMMVEEGEPKVSIRIEDKKMECCPLCGCKKITGPHHKRETSVSPVVLAYTCTKCSYTQYVHTGDSKFLKSVNIVPTKL
jgi:DNA-directed RNA polymerase subunit M/transcription elongation factor TFIIS